MAEIQWTIGQVVRNEVREAGRVQILQVIAGYGSIRFYSLKAIGAFKPGNDKLWFVLLKNCINHYVKNRSQGVKDKAEKVDNFN